MQEALQILKTHWQHYSFRYPQAEIIASVLQGNDTFALLPTGGGKSVCFQVPALMLEGLCLVISPLVALMEDQVKNLKQKGIKAVALTGAMPFEELNNELDNCKFGGYKFLYLSPERLQNDWITDRIKELPINLIAIDEAHCVSQWGHDFRPAYLKISNLKIHFPKTPFIALTASATLQVQQDIVTLLNLRSPKVFKKSFARENIAYMVFECEDKMGRMAQILTKNPGPAIVYVRNRKACNDVSRQLTSMGFGATYYHGGLKQREKKANMEAWISEKLPVMVATNAFGMGIDKPNVKTVTHIQLPENLESYYQEAGRAGRNGAKSFATTLLHHTDIVMAHAQFLDGLPDKTFLAQVYKKLNAFFQIAYGEGTEQIYPFNFNDFCKKYNFPSVKAFNAIQFLDRQGILTISHGFTEKAYVQFLIPSKEVIRYNSLNPADEPVILVILRTYTGIFDNETPINSNSVATKAKITTDKLFDILKRLHVYGAISLRLTGNDSTIIFNEIREDDRTINRISKFLEQQNSLKKMRFEKVISYVTDHQKCKSRILLEYFDETDPKDCGICSYCITKKQSKANTPATPEDIIDLISKKPLTSQEIQYALGLSSEQTVMALQLLLNAGKITINTNNEYTLVL